MLRGESIQVQGDRAKQFEHFPWPWSPTKLELYISDLGRQIEAIASKPLDESRDYAAEAGCGLCELGREAACELGRHYGYPECCIAFFVDSWFGHGGSDVSLRETYFFLRSASGLDQIPCPRCMRRALGESTLSVEEVKREVATKLRRQRLAWLRFIKRSSAAALLWRHRAKCQRVAGRLN
jgi:hypothetical protein